jgi:hypothetical protein
MKTLKNNRRFNRNLKVYSIPKKIYSETSDTTRNSKNNLTFRPLSKNYIPFKDTPTLYFPIKETHNKFLFPTHRDVSLPFSYTRTLYNDSFNANKTFRKKMFKSKLNRPVNLKNVPISKEKLKHLNIIDFGSTLKIYDEKEKRYKKKVILDKMDRQLDEIYYDYDYKNRKEIVNSFSGNRADLLRNKVSFVTGIMNYLYPKIVLNKMEFLKKMKNIELIEEKKQLEIDLKGKYFNLKHKNPYQNAAVSKYFYMDDFKNLKYGKYLERPKAIINNNVISKLKYEYDFV